VQWHVARLVPRLDLDDRERAEAVAQMVRLLEESPIGIVEADALQAVLQLADGHPEHEEAASRCAQRALASPSASLRARALRLVRRRPGR
jgi:hypothetical protein